VRENGVTAADLVFAVAREVMKLGIRLREDSRIGHCQYSCHYDWSILRCFAYPARTDLALVDCREAVPDVLLLIYRPASKHPDRALER
jgi:hypothetical protein